MGKNLERQSYMLDLEAYIEVDMNESEPVHLNKIKIYFESGDTGYKIDITDRLTLEEKKEILNTI